MDGPHARPSFEDPRSVQGTAGDSAASGAVRLIEVSSHPGVSSAVLAQLFRNLRRHHQAGPLSLSSRSRVLQEGPAKGTTGETRISFFYGSALIRMFRNLT